jgi:hypothetical protein
MTNTSLIFDIGCHEGQDSDFYLRKGFTVVAVEANPALCVQLKQRFSQEIEDGQFTLVENNAMYLIRFHPIRLRKAVTSISALYLVQRVFLEMNCLLHGHHKPTR